MDYKKIKYHLLNNTAHIILNSPENLNALDEAMLDDLIIALDRCADDKNVRVVIIGGEGNSFSAGGDLKAMLKQIEGDQSSFNSGVLKLGLAALRIRNLRKPVIAAIKGAAAGAGFNLALLCDFRIAAENASFIQTFVSNGLIPDMGGTFLLTRILGIARATELTMLGRPINSQEALALGLVNRVVPLEKLEDAAVEMAARLSSMPDLTLGDLKSLINSAAFQGFQENLDNEMEYQIRYSKTEDFVEVIGAYAKV